MTTTSVHGVARIEVLPVHDKDGHRWVTIVFFDKDEKTLYEFTAHEDGHAPAADISSIELPGSTVSVYVKNV